MGEIEVFGTWVVDVGESVLLEASLVVEWLVVGETEVVDTWVIAGETVLVIG